jgi:hypothetical protein
LRQIGGFPVSSTNKTYRHDKTEILLKVALTTISLNQPINGIVIVKEIMYRVKYGTAQYKFTNESLIYVL